MSAADLLMKSYFAAWVIETPRTPGYVAGNVNTMRLAELYDDFRAAEARIRELERTIEYRTELLRWAYGKLAMYSFSKIETAMKLDEIRLLLEQSQSDRSEKPPR